MKIPVFCRECDPSLEGAALPRVEGHITDEGLVRYACAAGHEGEVPSLHEKYELLFESASYALLDGYPREAVTGFAVSLERFYEFAIRVLVTERAIPVSAADKAWRTVASQSERQFGAFVFLYLLHTQGSFEIPNRWLDLRNRCVHRGYLPTAREAHGYGDFVWATLTNIRRELREGASFGWSAVTHATFMKRAAGNSMSPVFVHCSMLASSSEEAASSFAERLQYLRKRLGSAGV